MQDNFGLNYSVFVQRKEVIPVLFSQPCGGVLSGFCNQYKYMCIFEVDECTKTLVLCESGFVLHIICREDALGKSKSRKNVITLTQD